MRNYKATALLGFFLCTLTVPLGALAAGASFQGAIAHYNSGKYGQALSEFKQFEASYPNNAMSHYYMALCYQSLGDRAEARKEFTLTNQYGDASLKNYAQRGLSSLGGSSGGSGSGSATSSASSSTNTGSTSAGATSSNSSSPHYASNGALTFSPEQLMAAANAGNGGGTSTNSPNASNASAASNISSSAPSAANQAKITEVLEFYTDWCPVCRKFAPMFSEAQSKLSNVSFKSYNAEDGDNAALVQKYSVSRYPTLVYFNSSGKVVRNIAIGYNSTTDFVNSVRWGR